MSLKRRRWLLLLLLLLMERWRWVEIKVGFWIKDFHVLQTEVEMIIDLSGNRRRIWVTMSSGKDSQLTLVSDIAACHRERETGEAQD
jgi:hypothetical protein